MTNNNLQLINNIQNKHLNIKYLRKISKNFKKLEKEIYFEINNTSKTLNILNKEYKFNFKITDIKKFKKFKTVAIIGMGGSILGAEAIYNFLKHKIKKNFYFFDDLRPKVNNVFRNKEKLNKVLFIIISKSGNTVETLSNFLNLNILKKGAKNIIIISEKKNNALNSISKSHGINYIEHKKHIGGRYSVLSEVGIIPAYFMDLDILKLRKNICNFVKTKKKLFLKDSAIKLSSLLNKDNISNIIFLNYAPELEKFLFWCQQLIAESLGKDGKGFLPIISSVPKDHHSLLQLYLDGPKDKLFYIFSIEDKINNKKINKDLSKAKILNDKKLSMVKNAQKKALIQIFKNKNIPFRQFYLKTIDEKVIGELFSYFILETVLIGKINNINPFDQPAVEQVKILTKKFLS